MADARFDGGGGVDIGPGEELVGASIEIRTRDESDHLHRGDVGALPAGELADVEARVLDSRAVEIDQVHRHLRSPLRLEHEAERAHAGEPAVAFTNLACDATRDRDVAGDEQQVDGNQRLAGAHRGRTERRVRRVGTEVGLAVLERVAPDVRKIATAGIGVVVEEHRNVVRLRPPCSELARGVSCLRPFHPGATQSHERNDVERTETRVDALVIRDRDVGRDRGPEVARRRSCVVPAGTREREDRSVVVGIGVQVDERRPAAVGNRAQRMNVATFRDVRHALEHVSQRMTLFGNSKGNPLG